MEVHQFNADSSDVSFDLELNGVTTGASLAAIELPPGQTVSPLTLLWLGRSTDGRVTLSISGAAGRTWTIEVSNDLTSWSEASGIEESNGVISIVEAPDATDSPRFFRAVVQP